MDDYNYFSVDMTMIEKDQKMRTYLVYYSTDQDRPVVDDIIKNRFISDLVVPLDILIYTRLIFRAMSTHSSPNEKLLKRRPRASSLRRIE
jgi:hypothetical protein